MAPIPAFIHCKLDCACLLIGRNNRCFSIFVCIHHSLEGLMYNCCKVGIVLSNCLAVALYIGIFSCAYVKAKQFRPTLEHDLWSEYES